MMKSRIGIILLTCFLSFGSCTQFFSTSLAKWSARDHSKDVPIITVGNVEDAIQKAENDPNLSLTILKGIDEALKTANEDEASALRAAALGAAANAAGLGHVVLNQLMNIPGALQDPENAIDLVVTIIGELKNLKEAGDALVAILPEPGTPAFDAFVEKASAEDLAVAAALILLASEAQNHDDAEDYLNNFDPNDPLAELTEAETFAVKLAEAAIAKGMDDKFKDLLSGLNLVEASDPDEPDPDPGP